MIDAPSNPFRSPSGCGMLRTGLVSAFAIAVIVSVGCSQFKLPASPFGSSDGATEYVGMEGQTLRPSEDVQIYQKVRQAKSQNAIVLQIRGANPPVRVLPLPPEGQSVFVSDLLKQSGVLEKLGQVDAVLFRDAPGLPGGIRMAVKMTPDHEQVRPESDYALQAGDRLVVRKMPPQQLNAMLKSAIGL